MAAVPATLKPVAGYFKLASDVEERDPAIAYWIRVYVMEKAIKLDSKSPEAKAFLTAIMDRLEKDKETLKDNEAVSTEIVGQAHVENYAQKLFENADSEDRSGQATLKTVRTYLATAQLFEILSVFEPELSEEVLEKQRYAKHRASVIMKALKTGEQPPPPENIAGIAESLGQPPVDSIRFLDENTGNSLTGHFIPPSINTLNPPYPPYQAGSSGVSENSTPFSSTPPAPPAPTPVNPCNHETSSISSSSGAVSGAVVALSECRAVLS